jgi:hypothetical protein
MSYCGGGHLSIIQEPGVKMTAQKMTDLLEALRLNKNGEIA